MDSLILFPTTFLATTGGGLKNGDGVADIVVSCFLLRAPKT